MSDKHSLRSSEREEYVEYIFLGALCSYGWSQDRFVEVARASTDTFGYDVVLSCDGVTRHVQLKASKADGATNEQTISLRLGEKASGCVIWMLIDHETLKPTTYRWFGAEPNHPLPRLGEKTAKHTKANADGIKSTRQKHRKLSKSRFEEVSTINTLFDRLFGPQDQTL